jgi:uncharacterized glyoxalase superfamily protein PhnB
LVDARKRVHSFYEGEAAAVKVKQAVPILRIFDEAMAREFYLDFLGSTAEFEHRFAPDLPLYMGISLGGMTIHLSGHNGDTTPGTRVYIEVADGLTEWAQELSAKQYKHARPGCPCQTEWGTQELTLTDPFGNRLTFAERLTK